MPREDALHAFRQAVNQPNTMFSTEHWLLPKLDSLRKLLHDPITDDEAMALLDVLHNRRWMKDLLEWLQGDPISWANFFVRRQFLEEEAKQIRQEELRKADEDWARGVRKPSLFDDLFTPEQEAEMQAEALASAKKTYLAKAKSCPRCGTPPEYLDWFRYSSPPSTWANLCGRAGWKTRCKFCGQQVDFFVTMLN
jgi:hypothetical protein